MLFMLRATRADASGGSFVLRFVTLALAVLLVFFIVAFARIFFKDYELRKEISRVEQDVARLEKRKIESLDMLKRLQSDVYIEERARRELQVVRPGEKVLVATGLVVTSSAAKNEESESIGTELSNWKRWWYYFFKPELGD